MTLGEYLKKLRKQQKKTLRMVEADTGISNAHLFQIEDGKISKPSMERLEKFANYYQVQLSYLKTLAGYESESKKEEDSLLTPLRFITASQINDFAQNKEAESLLPELIRDLIVSTVNLDFLEMPVGNSVYMHGWDGLLNCKGKSSVQFVPEGFSCWEMSRSKEASKKMEADFSKRTKKPLGQKITNSTYIQVFFRRLEKKEKAKLLESVQLKSKWKEVKIIDAEDLELWLERSPSVALTYAKRMKLLSSASGILPLSNFWDEWWHSTEPPLDQELLIEAGKNCDGIDEFINTNSVNHVKIKSNDVKLGVAFLYAKFSKIASADQNKDVTRSRYLISRSIVVENEDALRMLIARGKKLILIPTFKTSLIGEAKANGHQVVSIISDFNANDLNAVGRVRTTVIAEHLKVEGGYSEERAYRIAKSCFGNLAVLKLSLSDSGQVTSPIWSRFDYAINLMPLLLLGGWNLLNENDRKIVEQVSGKSYDEVEAYLLSIPEDSSSLFQKTNTSIVFYQEYAYAHLAKHFDNKILEKFFEAARQVLTNINTKYELEIEKRFAADIYKKGHLYSSQIRTSISTSIAILATNKLDSGLNLNFQINYLVEEVFKNQKDWQFWASLSDVITLLAEASPKSFLDCLEPVCDQGEFTEIFKQTTTMGGCEYASLLWALESCAWENRHFKQVTKILLKMTSHENKSNNYVNQPSKTLWDIYRIWANQSTVPFKMRIQILKELEKDGLENQIWKLILRLIPSRPETGSYTYKPRFRDIDIKNEDLVDVDYLTAVNEITDYIFHFLDKDPSKWADCLDLVFRIRPASYQTKFLDRLLKLINLSDEKSFMLWLDIEKKLSHHLEFPDSDWSTKGNNIQKVKEIYSFLTPKDPLKRWSHIFDHYISHPQIENQNHDYEKKQKDLFALQKNAIAEILPQNNLSLLKDLIAKVPNSWILGKVLAETHVKSLISIIESLSLEEKDRLLLNGLIHGYFVQNGLTGIEVLLKKPIFKDKYLRAEVYLSLPFKRETWDSLSLEVKDIQSQYWSSIKRPYVSENLDDAIFVIEKLLEVKKPLDAFYVLANFERKGDGKISTKLAMRVLDEVMTCDFSDKTKNNDFGLFDYHLEQVLKDLSTRADVDKRKLALIDWNFLPLFKYRKKPQNLISEVNNDPSLFIEILSFAYKKDDRTKAEKVVPELANRAYDYLHETKVLPGIRSDGTFDSEHFQQWFLKVRELAKNSNRLKSCDNVLGQMMAYSPFDPEDKGWPHKSIRELIEKFCTDEMQSGLSVGVFNKRGVFYRSPGEGGLQERNIAKTYGDYAAICEFSSPKTGSILRGLEARYLSDAHREDLRSLHE